ncbi:sensor histidine kinase [Balneola sp. MJW-20]|uniref:sensor histidine kinase n=1 Tax=Gracilimonas aurantiaca TaxID=3234185 RepID=UPI00390BB6E3
MLRSPVHILVLGIFVCSPIFVLKKIMPFRRLKIAEWGIHALAVLVLVLTGLDSYRTKIMIMIEQGFPGKVGSMITTNAYQDFWHILIFGLYILTWFLFYYGIYQRYEGSLKKKVLGGIAGWIIFSLTHGGIVYVVSQILASRPVMMLKKLSFNIEYQLGQTIFDLYFIIGVVAFMAHTTMQFLYRYQELEQADKVQSELSLIRSQLRPHFFFNTLNNLYSMALDTGNETLATGIQNLTGMMRYSMKQSTQDLVPVAEEWDYIQRYVDLQRLRVEEENVKIDLNSSGNLSAARIAPMILINFVENAFKHGISYEKKSFVDISLQVTMEEITLQVKNSNHPSVQDSGESGIGTEQTKRLLSLQYQDTYDLNITSDPDWYQVVLTLPSK